MSATKVFIEPNEDVVFTVSKIADAGSRKVVLIVPAAANIVSSQVSMKLLNRMLSRVDKLVVVVTDDELGLKYAAHSGMAAVPKISEVTTGIWEKANELKQNFLLEKDRKKMDLLAQRSAGDYQIVDGDQDSISDGSEADTGDKVRLIINEPDGSDTPDEFTQPTEPVAPVDLTEAKEEEEEVKPIFNKLDPKLIDLDQYAILTGGDVAANALGQTLRNKMRNISKLREQAFAELHEESSPKKKVPDLLASAATTSAATPTSTPTPTPDPTLEPAPALESPAPEISNQVDQLSGSIQSSVTKGIDSIKGMFAKRPSQRPRRPVPTDFGAPQRRGTKVYPPVSASARARANRSSSSNRLAKGYWQKFNNASANYWQLVVDHKRKAAAGLVALVIVFLGFSVFAAPQAEVRVKVSSKSIPISEQIRASSDISQVDISALTIPMRNISRSESRSDTRNATGTGESGDKARGTIIISNQRPEPVEIKAGTVITAVGRNNIDYVIDTDVVLPATGNANTVRITAAELGSNYNQTTNAKKDFRFKDLNNDQIFLFTYAEITGGSREEVKVISESDYNDAVAEVKGLLTERLRSEVMGLVSSDEITLEDEIRFSEPEVNSDRSIGDKADSFNITVTIRAEVSAVRKQDMLEIASELVREQSQIASDVEIVDLSDPVISDISVDGGNATFNLATSAIASASYNDEQIRSRVLGVSTNAVEGHLLEMGEIEEVELDYSPSFLPGFLRRMPNNSERVQVYIRSE